ncbi:NYN domain-containing protein [Anaerovoracaceae bacterium 41-7]
MAIYFIDGDNISIKNDVLQYMYLLDESDEIYCFVNECSKSEKIKDDMKKRSKSKITEYIVVLKLDNAVDFAIAVRATSIVMSRQNGEIYLISKDKHFDLMCNEIKKISSTNKIERLDSIDIAILKKMIHEDSIEHIEAFLNTKLDHYGTPLLNNIKEIIRKNEVSQNINEIGYHEKESTHPFRVPFFLTKMDKRRGR